MPVRLHLSLFIAGLFVGADFGIDSTETAGGFSLRCFSDVGGGSFCVGIASFGGSSSLFNGTIPFVATIAFAGGCDEALVIFEESGGTVLVSTLETAVVSAAALIFRAMHRLKSSLRRSSDMVLVESMEVRRM